VGVEIVTGDTKVVRHGECDGLFINTAGIGIRPLGKGLSSKLIVAGDAILLSGTVGDHGIDVLGAREDLAFRTTIQSDCAPLSDLIETVLHQCDGIKWMRDPTRGGVAAVLTELVEMKPYGAIIRESAIPVREEVNAICELLGFDPMHLANEGKVLLVVEEGQEQQALQLLRSHPLGKDAAIIGRVTAEGAGYVRVETPVGGVRRLQRPSGELLPRIC
jgi:hydrogenase expression/formation protein HypE